MNSISTITTISFCNFKNFISFMATMMVFFFFATILWQLLMRHYRQRRHVFTFNPDDRRSSPEAPYCAVCLHEAVKGERLRKLPKCKHCFHVECIETWFKSHPTCPLCRTQVFVPKNQTQHNYCFFSCNYFVSLFLDVGNKLSHATILDTSFMSSTHNSRGSFNFF